MSVRQGRGTQTLDVARVMNCTGPEPHPGRAANPLLQGLIGDRVARPDALGLGLAVDAESRVVGGKRLGALLALRRGLAHARHALGSDRDSGAARTGERRRAPDCCTISCSQPPRTPSLCQRRTAFAFARRTTFARPCGVVGSSATSL